MHRFLKRSFLICSLGYLLIFSDCNSVSQKTINEMCCNDYHVAAYVWPSCHDDARGREFLWPEGTGEWELIKKGFPMFEGHYQPRIPLWGYQMDDDPAAWEQKIDAATDHGVNMIIFDWYWYDEGPFLEDVINNGSDDMLWNGEIDWENFRIIVARIIRQYFNQPNYFKIDSEPFFSIFSIRELLNSFNGIEGVAETLDYFREEVKKAGYPGLHVQGVGHAGKKGVSFGGLKLNSATMYNMHGGSARKYGDYLMYWDNTPHYPERAAKGNIIYMRNTPQSFATYLKRAKDYADEHPEQPKLIIINAWNEWVEGIYLEPDMLWGYGYLEAVKKVMNGRYDRY